MPTSPPLPLALFGCGHLGKIHAKCLAELPDDVTVVGVFDEDPTRATAVAGQYGWRAFAKTADLYATLEAAGPMRAVDIVTPTTTHHVLAKAALRAGCHVFVEKPITSTTAEASDLESLSEQLGLVVQVGHVERFNPAFRHVAAHGIRPVFVEAHRLAQFNPRALDVSVVLDLMIHDIDLVLSLVDSEVAHVSASGVGVVGDAVDIASARLDFADGTTANLTASRISLKNMRKLRLFARDAYVGLDLMSKEAEVVTLSDHDPAAPGPFQLPTAEGLREVTMTQPEIAPANAIRDELAAFAKTCRDGGSAVVTAGDGRRALELAERILADMSAREALRPAKPPLS